MAELTCDPSAGGVEGQRQTDPQISLAIQHSQLMSSKFRETLSLKIGQRVTEENEISISCLHTQVHEQTCMHSCMSVCESACTHIHSTDSIFKARSKQ